MTRKKFVPLFTESGTGNRMVAVLPGRHPCQCLAVRHCLVANCTNCGRIVCEQEGQGTCYFCGNLVLSAEDRKNAEANTNAARKRIVQIQSTPWAPGTPPPPWTTTRKLCRRYGNRSKNRPVAEEGGTVESGRGNSLNESEPEGQEEWLDDEAEIDYPSNFNAQSRLEEGMEFLLY
nr:activating signal cointegrator 1 [Hymenolepis microstoma]